MFKVLTWSVFDVVSRIILCFLLVNCIGLMGILQDSEKLTSIVERHSLRIVSSK